MIQRIGCDGSSQRYLSRGIGLRNTQYRRSRQELLERSAERVVNAKQSNAKSAIRRTVRVLRNRLGGWDALAQGAARSMAESALRAYGVQPELLPYAIEEAMRLCANPHSA